MNNEILTVEEKKKYAMADKRDFEILSKIKKLEKFSLPEEDKFLVEFLRTQLEKDWRTSLITLLDNLLKKYEKVK